MKKQLLKKMFALLLAGTMVMGLAACGGDDEKEPEDPGTEQEEDGAGDGTEEPAEGGEVSYPLETDTELSYWCGQFIDLAEDVDTWEDSLADKQVCAEDLPGPLRIHDSSGFEVTRRSSFLNEATDRGPAHIENSRGDIRQSNTSDIESRSCDICFHQIVDDP